MHVIIMDNYTTFHRLKNESGSYEPCHTSFMCSCKSLKLFSLNFDTFPNFPSWLMVWRCFLGFIIGTSLESRFPCSVNPVINFDSPRIDQQIKSFYPTDHKQIVHFGPVICLL